MLTLKRVSRSLAQVFGLILIMTAFSAPAARSEDKALNFTKTNQVLKSIIDATYGNEKIVGSLLPKFDKAASRISLERLKLDARAQVNEVPWSDETQASASVTTIYSSDRANPLAPRAVVDVKAEVKTDLLGGLRYAGRKALEEENGRNGKFHEPRVEILDEVSGLTRIADLKPLLLRSQRLANDEMNDRREALIDELEELEGMSWRSDDYLKIQSLKAEINELTRTMAALFDTSYALKDGVLVISHANATGLLAATDAKNTVVKTATVTISADRIAMDLVTATSLVPGDLEKMRTDARTSLLNLQNGQVKEMDDTETYLREALDSYKRMIREAASR